jgi:RelB Antitoxin alpha helical domain
MLQINKNYVLDQDYKPIAVQISVNEFEEIEEILENYGLSKLIERVENNETLVKNEALKYLELLGSNNVES